MALLFDKCTSEWSRFEERVWTEANALEVETVRYRHAPCRFARLEIGCHASPQLTSITLDIFVLLVKTKYIQHFPKQSSDTWPKKSLQDAKAFAHRTPARTLNTISCRSLKAGSDIIRSASELILLVNWRTVPSGLRSRLLPRTVNGSLADLLC